MELQVRCRCNVVRKIDPAKVGSFRLRCKQCGDVLFDPHQAAPVPLDPFAKPAPAARDPGMRPSGQGRIGTGSDDGDTDFQKRLLESAELNVMMSSDGEQAVTCRRHKKRRVVAACTRCADLLCKDCLDRIGDEFVCSKCIAQVATGEEAIPSGGVMSFFRKLFRSGNDAGQG